VDGENRQTPLLPNPFEPGLRGIVWEECFYLPQAMVQLKNSDRNVEIKN